MSKYALCPDCREYMDWIGCVFCAGRGRIPSYVPGTNETDKGVCPVCIGDKGCWFCPNCEKEHEPRTSPTG